MRIWLHKPRDLCQDSCEVIIAPSIGADAAPAGMSSAASTVNGRTERSRNDHMIFRVPCALPCTFQRQAMNLLKRQLTIPISSNSSSSSSSWWMLLKLAFFSIYDLSSI
jgi:hypothetical protein